MFNFKSKVLGAAAAALPVVAAGLLGSAGSAEAAVLTGEAAFSGTSLGFGSATAIQVSESGISFTSPGLVALTTGTQTGSFTSFTNANIYNISPISGTFPDPGELLLDFGIDPATVSDGKNIFLAKSASEYNIVTDATTGTGSSISLVFHGNFIGENLSEVSKGFVNLNFTSTQSVDYVKSVLLPGGSRNGQTLQLSFSGAGIVASVPEPTTMLGLGLVAAGMTVARRRKLVKA